MVCFIVSTRNTAVDLDVLSIRGRRHGVSPSRGDFPGAPAEQGDDGSVGMTIFIIDIMFCGTMSLRKILISSSVSAWLMVPAVIDETEILTDPRRVLVGGHLAPERDLVMRRRRGGAGDVARDGRLPGFGFRRTLGQTVVHADVDAILATVVTSEGSTVAGTVNHEPGSKSMPTGWLGTVMSLIVWR